MPPPVQQTVAAAEAAFERRDAPAVCPALGQLQSAMYAWGANSRGNLSAAVHRSTEELVAVSHVCSSGARNAGEAGSADPLSAASHFEVWSTRARDAFRKDTNYVGLWLWFVGPVLIGAAIMYLRRTFG